MASPPSAPCRATSSGGAFMSEKSPTIPTSDDRIIAALSYIGGLFGLGPIVPIFVFLLRGKDSPFVRFHSAQAIALELAVIVISTVLGFCLFAIFFLGASAQAQAW